MATYPGGKAGQGVYQAIICQLPPHDVYIEPFLGGGAILRLKRPARQSSCCDVDAAVIAAFGDGGPGVELQKANALDFLAAYPWRGGELVYCDPPYLMSTRRSRRRIYRHDFSQPQDHEALLKLLKALPCMVAITGYASSLYASMLEDWREVTFTATTRGGTKAVEHLWMNYPAPLQLHDYRYLGGDFRERERIKRKARRWLAKLHGLPLLERQAIFAELEAASPAAVLAGIGEQDQHATSGDGDVKLCLCKKCGWPGRTAKNGDTSCHR